MAVIEVGQTTSAVRNDIDIRKLEMYLTEHLEGFKLPLHVAQFKFGQSNPTYLLTDKNGVQRVLRKKPSGSLISSTAHAIEREYRVLDAINRSDKGIPVPKVYLLCEDASVLGTSFYVMEFLKGRILSDVTFSSMSIEDRRQCWFSVLDALAALHSVDYRSVGLSTFGRSTEFYSRQIRSLRNVSQAQAAVRDTTTNTPVGPLPRLDEMLTWFQRNQVSDQSAIIHGDFKIDNVVFHPTEPRVIGILDWELSTIGHPLSDLANLLQPFAIPPNGNFPKNLPIVGLKGSKSLPVGLPTEQELLQYYCKQSGRPNVDRWEFCTAFSFFRLAVITQGIAARNATGQASSAEARTYAKLFVPMSLLALEFVERGDLPEGNARSSKL